MSDTVNKPRGFAAMKLKDPARMSEIASSGGKAAHIKGNAHEFDHREAVEAGRKGGESLSRDREHMARIGKKGGERSKRVGPHADPTEPKED